MKALVFGFLALVATVAARPAAAHSEPERAEARATAALVAAPRPLVRFLINSLQLPDQQALQVEQALKHHPLHTSSPEELAAALQDVLTPEQLAQLRTLRTEDELQDDLRYLATLH